MPEKIVKISLWFDYPSFERFVNSFLFQRIIGQAIEHPNCIAWEHEEVEEVW